MSKLHYVVYDRATNEPRSLIAASENDVPHFVHKFDSFGFTLRGLTEAEFETYIVFGTLEEEDASKYFEVDNAG